MILKKCVFILSEDFFYFNKQLFVVVFLGCTSMVLTSGKPEGSTGSGSGFKASKTGQWLKVSTNRLGRAGNQTCNPWFKDFPTPQQLLNKQCRP